MTTPKRFLCRCEDITVDDACQAISEGYACFEDLKRYLGVATGPCQGKSCVPASMQLVAQQLGVPLDEVDTVTMRPPVRPIRFDTLAAADARPAPAPPDAGRRGGAAVPDPALDARHPTGAP